MHSTFDLFSPHVLSKNGNLSFSSCFKNCSDLYLIGISEHDKEGRVITAEYEKFFLVTSCMYQYICSKSLRFYTSIRKGFLVYHILRLVPTNGPDVASLASGLCKLVRRVTQQNSYMFWIPHAWLRPL